ncbi:hypothetical protein BV22DRAFT_987684, partial [Leucogyrophana mollusca]
MSTTTTAVLMPARGDRTAPVFDSANHGELFRYFENLEFLFDRASILSNSDRKKYTTYYADLEASELWESLPEFSDTTKSHQAFIEAIYPLYPEVESGYRWTRRTLRDLVLAQSQHAIQSLSDLGGYYRKFLPIATFLCRKGTLGQL